MPIVGAFATSHAYTFQEPETWDQRRERSKTNVARRRPAARRPTRAQAQAETLEDNRDALRAHPRRARGNPRALDAAEGRRGLLIGDDQAENFTADNMPQLLVYTGGDYSPTTGTASTRPRSERSARSRARWSRA